MSPTAYPGPREALERYDALLAGNPAVDRKGARNPYTSRNGHMFSFLDQDGRLSIRMSAKAQAEFLASYESGPVEQYGRTMRDYVSVPPDLFARTAELQPWFDAAHEWIGTLTPRPTTRRPRA